MKKAPYQSSVWMRTDSSGLTVQVNGRNPFDGGFLSFETPLAGVEFIEKLLQKIKSVEATATKCFYWPLSRRI